MVSRITLEEEDKRRPHGDVSKEDMEIIETRADEFRTLLIILISSDTDVLKTKFNPESDESIVRYREYFRRYIGNVTLLPNENRPMSITSIKAGILFEGISSKEYAKSDRSGGERILHIELIDHLSQIPQERIIKESVLTDEFKEKFNNIRDAAAHFDGSKYITDGPSWGRLV